MSHWAGRIALALCTLLLSIFALVRWAQSCSEPGDPFADYSQHPDVPIEKFVQGQLGIVEPSFARSYLVVAYRYASGVPLTKDEQEAAIALWEYRGIEDTNIYPNFYSNGGADVRRQNRYLQDAQDEADGPKDWLDARSQIVPSPAPQIEQIQSLASYNSYVNCSNDAFANAAATLKARAEKFGKDNPAIKDWVAAQDAVFANCAGGSDKPNIPPAPNAALPELLRFDREYQIAAAYMYTNRFDDAVHGFQHIADEKNSPWHDLAPYLAARTMLRRATLDVPRPEEPPKNGYASIPPFVPEKMQAAIDYTTKTLVDYPKSPFAQQMQALLDRGEFRLHPAEQTVRLSHDLSKPAPEGRFYNWLWDYTWLLDRRGDARGDFGQGGSSEQYAKLLPDRQKDALTDWLITFQMQDALATRHALEVWRAHRDSLPWLLAVLSKTEFNAPQVSEVLTAADLVPASSPAYVSVFYERMRLGNGLGKFPEVRQSIDAYLASSPDLPSVAKDYLLDLRLDAAGDLNDAIRFLPRESCSVDSRQPPPNCSTTLAEHSASYLNALPLDVMVDVLHSKNLPDQEKAKFVRNVWLRAILLDRHDVAQSLDAQAFRSGAYPAPLGDDVIEKLVKEYESASTPDVKRFAAIFLMQHQYAFGYSIGSNGPWCARSEAKEDLTFWRNTHPSESLLSPPPFLTEAQRKQAEGEQSTLDHTDSQANYYTQVVLTYAQKHPDDPRVPEALSRAVKNTRMNCNNARTGALSKGAFDLLHNRYPDTTWAKNTRYWFGDN
jgi:hypothetical protein